MNRKMMIAVLFLANALGMCAYKASAQIPYGAPATSSILNSTFGAKAYPNTWTSPNTFSSSITSSGNNTWSGTNAFSGSTTFTSPLTGTLGSFSSISDSGTLSAGATTLGSAVVSGNGSFGGTLSALGTTSLGVVNTSALATLNSGAVTTNFTVGGTLGVTGTSTFGVVNMGAGTASSLSVTGNETVSGNLTVTGTTTTNGALNANGTNTLASVGVTGSATVGGTLGVTGDITASAKLKAASEFILDSETNSALTGSLAFLSGYTHPTVILTNASLVSLGSIGSPVAGKVITLIIRTGSSLTLVNQDGTATAANRIVTGTGSNLTAAADSTLILIYSSNDSRWHIAGGSGAGGVGTQAQNEGSATAITTLAVPNNQFTTTATNTRLVETGNGNVLVNPNFQASTASTGWTVTNSTASTDTAVFPQGSKQSLKLTLSAQTGTILEQSVTPPTGQAIFGNWEYNLSILTASSGGKICSLQGTTEVTCWDIIADSLWHSYPVNFPGSSVSNGIRVKETTTTTGTFNFGLGYVGPARNIGSVYQPQLLGTVKISGCAAAWTTTSTTYAAYPVQTGCTYTATGQALAPSTMEPGIRFASVPAGNIVLKYTGQLGLNSATETRWRWTDGTNTAKADPSNYSPNGGSQTELQQTIFDHPGGSNVTFQIYGQISSGTGASIVAGNIQPALIEAWWFPTSSQQAVQPSQQGPYYWYGYHSNTPGSDWHTTSTGWVDTSTATGIVLTPQSTSGISCSTASGSLPGLSCTFPKTGKVKVCATVQVASNTVNGYNYAKLVDGSGTLISGGKLFVSGTASQMGQIPLCGPYNVTSLSSATTFKIQSQTGGAGGTTYISSSQSGDSAIQWEIEPLENFTNSPLLTGNMTSRGASSYRVESASGIGTGSACTPSTTTGTAFISSCSRSGTGAYALTYANPYTTVAPLCFIQPFDGAGDTQSYVSSTTTTGVNLQMRTTAPAAVDTPWKVICLGGQ